MYNPDYVLQMQLMKIMNYMYGVKEIMEYLVMEIINHLIHHKEMIFLKII